MIIIMNYIKNTFFLFFLFVLIFNNNIIVTLTFCGVKFKNCHHSFTYIFFIVSLTTNNYSILSFRLLLIDDTESYDHESLSIANNHVRIVIIFRYRYYCRAILYLLIRRNLRVSVVLCTTNII